MLNAVNFYFCDRAAGHRRQQDAPKGITKGVPKTTLEWLKGNLRASRRLFIDLNDAGGKELIHIRGHRIPAIDC